MVFHVAGEVFQVGWHVADGHEGHERAGEEERADERVNVNLLRTEPEPYCAHHECETCMGKKRGGQS